jgi:hypothetical protein
MVEVATEGDFLVFEFWIGAGDGGGDDFVVAGMLAGFHDCMKCDLVIRSFSEPFFHRVRRFQGNHEGESFVGRKCFEVAPADGVLIFA